MNSKQLSLWFSIVSIILILFGIYYAFFGLGTLPVDKSVLLTWESAIYGAIMIGWGITLVFIGGLAFRKNDRELLGILAIGIFAWLIVEALFSAALGVWFNVGVDIGVLILFTFPLLMQIKKLGEKEGRGRRR